jgi:hypothetical protein
MPNEQAHSSRDAARLHERAALFFELLDQRERAAREREQARRLLGRDNGDGAGSRSFAGSDDGR